MKKVLFTLVLALACLGMNAQTPLPKVYDESIDPLKQIEQTVSRASKNKKNIIVQLGGNWCIWCLRFADFITKDTEIKSIIDTNYEYIHVNIPRRGTPQYDAAAPLQKRLNNAGRFGYPVLVVLRARSCTYRTAVSWSLATRMTRPRFSASSRTGLQKL